MDNIYEPDWLNRAMADAKIRTGQLARVSGVSRSQIQRIRNGAPPRLDTLRALSGALATLQQERAA
jgi:transcriptional regulator with XRE-family HTH domain